MMNANDKKIRITLRLNERQFEFVKYGSDALGVSPSEFLRMVVNMAMVSDEKNVRGKSGRENDKANCNYIL